jgi:hypothetical protein
MKFEGEDGFYQARSGNIEKLVFENEGTKKLRVTDEVFQEVVKVQKQMRQILDGRKPDLQLVAEAMLLFAAEEERIIYVVREHCAKVFTRSPLAENGKV